MLAQALLEKAALDSIATRVSTIAGDVTVAFQDKPWLWAVVAAGVFLLIRRWRR